MKFIKKSRRTPKKAVIEESDEDDPILLLEDSRIVSFANTQKTINGFVVLEGWNIEEAELEIKFTKPKKPVQLKTKIVSGSPWRLKQIQSVYEYCKLGRQYIEESLASLNDLGSIPPNNATQIIKQTMDILCSANTTLLLPSRSQAAAVQGTGQFKFEPQLPSNVLLDFKIKQMMVVVTAALIRPLQKQNSEKPEKDIKENKKNFL